MISRKYWTDYSAIMQEVMDTYSVDTILLVSGLLMSDAVVQIIKELIKDAPEEQVFLGRLKAELPEEIVALEAEEAEEAALEAEETAEAE